MAGLPDGYATSVEDSAVTGSPALQQVCAIFVLFPLLLSFWVVDLFCVFIQRFPLLLSSPHPPVVPAHRPGSRAPEGAASSHACRFAVTPHVRPAFSVAILRRILATLA